MNLKSWKVMFSLLAGLLAVSTTHILSAVPTLKTEQSSAATVFSTAVPLPNFSLLDTSNKPFTHTALKSKWTLLFFGYTQCPKICPQTLAIVTEAWRALSQPNAQFIFVTLDPHIDTPAALKQFLTNFNSNFIGLTGDEAEIKKLAQACRIYSWTDPNLNATGQKIIDHSASLLLLNPQGQLQALFSPPHHSDTLARELKALMKSGNL